MAKLYHKVAGRSPQVVQPEPMLAEIDAFLRTCRSPVLLEPGESSMPLVPGQYELLIRGGKLWIECWGETRSVSRKITGIVRSSSGALECSILLFGGKSGNLSFLDLDRPQTAHKSLAGERKHFSELFRRMLFRQFPGWNIEQLSSGMDLQRSLSPVFPRARLSRGHHQIAALACPSPEEESAALTFAVIWHDHVLNSGSVNITTSLSIFLPEGAGNLTAHRLRWLRTDQLQPRIFLYNQDGMAGEVDPLDLGNLDTRVESPRLESQNLSSDISSERWLEVCVRANLPIIDPSLLPDPVHKQILTFAARDRNLIDLLAVSQTGRLCVLELKVSEDIHLPLQALDYWMRICWHTQRGELSPLFRGIPLESQPPRLFLIAPAMSFHPANATVLRYFSPQIEVERVGINSEWQTHLKVVLRLQGADSPISHGALNES